MTITANPVHEIMTNLTEQERIYRRLLDLSQAQVVAIRQQDVRTVHALLQEIELAMIERSTIERRRSEVLHQLSRAWMLPVDQLTATVIADRSDEPAIADAIRHASAALRSLIGELDTAVVKARGLLKQELALIDHMVRGVTRSHEPPTYQQSGIQTEVPRLKLLDTQV
jgi:hypothetical protein